MKTFHSRLKRGAVLLASLVAALLIALGLTLTAAFTASNTLGRSARFELDHTRSLAAAEGANEIVQHQLLASMANFSTPVLEGTVAVGGSSWPFEVTPLGGSFTDSDPDGVTSSVQRYLVTSTASFGDSSVTVRRVVDLRATPLFQYMIFYDDDLEILPGPDMTLGGRVHANGDIYVGCGGTLTVDTEYFRATGDILRRRKNDGSESLGTVRIKVTGDPSYENLENAHDAEYTGWATHALETWNGTVQDGAHGVSAVEAPDIGTIKAFEPDGSKGYYHENADLVIVDTTAYDSDGNALSLPVGTVVERTMYDAREGRNVTVTEINIALLNTSGRFPPNGLVYAYRTDATPSQPNGIRLTDGAELAAPLTVVTEDPLYVRGDFNTVNKKGAAVMADAVSLLSNAWNDSKTAGSLPTASATTYNLAFISGNVRTPDGGGNYSGGFENLPRFHERWTGITATIRGAFINMYESEIAKSPWRYGGDVYTAPTRDWAYDPALNDLENLPPFTPNTFEFERLTWDDSIPLPFST
jgi:hypothetical protein